MKIKNMKQVREHMKGMNMKRPFRRNQIVITVLIVVIAVAGHLNYAGKKDPANGNTVYGAGAMDISDEDILAEDQAVPLTGQLGLQEIPSLDQDPSNLDAVSDAGGVQATVDPRMDAGALAQTGNNATVEEAAQAADVGQIADTGQTAQVGMDGSTQTGLENLGEAVLTSGMGVADYIANVQLSKEQIRAKNKETLMTLTNSISTDEAAKQQAIQDMIRLTETSERGNAAETLLMAEGFPDPVVSTTRDRVDAVISAPPTTDPQCAQTEDIVKHKVEVGVD